MNFLNRCIWTAAAGGTSDFTVSAAAQNGYIPSQCKRPIVVNGAPYHYFANNSTEHEEGDGVFNTGTSVLTRANIRNSSNSGNKVNFSSAPTVFMGGPVADDMGENYCLLLDDGFSFLLLTDGTDRLLLAAEELTT